MKKQQNLMAWVAEVSGFPEMIVLAEKEPDVYKAVKDSLRIRSRSVTTTEISATRAPRYDFLGEENEKENWPPARMLVLDTDTLDWAMP